MRKVYSLTIEYKGSPGGWRRRRERPLRLEYHTPTNENSDMRKVYSLTIEYKKHGLTWGLEETTRVTSTPGGSYTNPGSFSNISAKRKLLIFEILSNRLT